MGTFYDFVRRIAVVNDSTTNPDDTDIPEKYEPIVDGVINTMKNRINNAKTSNVAFIEKCFDDNDVADIMRQKMINNELPDGEVPDGIINKLSMSLYEKPFNDLSNDEQSIIKVLTVYIIVQI